MANLTENDVKTALREVRDPVTGRGLAELGAVSDVALRGGHVSFAIEVAPERARTSEALRKAAEDAIASLPGVLSASVVLTAHKPRNTAPAQPHAHAHGPASPQPRTQPRGELPGVAAIVAVGSGKGGVGKSTVAVNLALGLAALGLKVGLLDADIYGPSVPRLLSIGDKPKSDGKRIKPIEKFGIKSMSIGFLVGEDTPMIWRGPMVMSAITQMLGDVDWAPLDVLVVDMPPGTGDAQLTLAQRVPLAGAVIVSTPQDLALIDAKKALAMFRKTEVPILGIIENMSVFVCPHCGTESHIFGHGGARETAAALGVDFLGEIPLVPAIRETSDAGTPVMAADPGGAEAKAFLAVARTLAGKVGAGAGARPAPKIVME